MIAIDPQQLTAAVFARLASDSAGTEVRSLLGSGSPPAIVHAEQLRSGSPPARPFLALRGEAIGGSTLDMRPVTWRWYVYDDPEQRYWRINAIVAALGAAYRPADTAIASGRTEVSGIGPETFDDTLGMVTRSVQITHYRRG